MSSGDDFMERLVNWFEYDEGKINDLRAEARDRIEALTAALMEWDALIEHQYSGSREAMSAMTGAAQRTARVLKGENHG